MSSSSPICFWLLFLIVLFYLPAAAIAQDGKINGHPSLQRKYRAGEVYRYRLTIDELHNGKWQSRNISVCELSVIKDSAGIFYDELRWISKQQLI